eukprot:CAMPEP_0115749544 /NCGR_PEP_ID=MMETSP0272-20121206/94245_1 /TAXON_ID=71861 /ORGANISM="Scrippsiella trochoidea, Strain CCMP3099" /LENGTH=32 /DNA_ID= /DNA_START= /DNA_END= /DNA_ORIENTATION=
MHVPPLYKGLEEVMKVQNLSKAHRAPRTWLTS